MDEILQMECRLSGPLPREDRWVLRFGGRTAYEHARAKAAIRYLTRECMAALDESTFHTLLDKQRAWRGYLRALA
jgi:hypothetical protein